MEHAKKMVLVDPRVLEQLIDKEAFEHEQLFEKKHFRPMKRKWHRLVFRNRKYMGDNTISDDQDMKMYSAALNRFLGAAKTIKMHWFAPVLGKLFQMGETAIITPSPDAEENDA